MVDKLYQLTAHELRDLLKAKKASAVEIAKSFIDRIDKVEERVKAYMTVTPEIALSLGMHHITAISSDIQRTDAFLAGVLGLRRVKMTTNFDDPGSAHWYWGVGDGQPGTVITYFGRDPLREPMVRSGAGQTHHYALAVPDDATQLECRERLLAAGLQVTPVLDRVYFRSIYTRDPDGHIVELATAGPGFLVDEDSDSLGRSLKLPPWLEARRPEIEGALHPLRTLGPLRAPGVVAEAEAPGATEGVTR